MTDVPTNIPMTTPVAFTVATAVVPLLHVPPVAASERAVVVPKHIPILPVIADIGFTVIILVTAQPAPKEYIIVAVPDDKPVTLRPASTPAIPPLAELHTPPVTASFRDIES